MEILADNSLYQNLLASNLDCAECQGDLATNILEQIGEDNVQLYRYFNSDLPTEVTPEKLENYLQFLDKFGYPDDDFLLVMLKVPDLTSDRFREKLDRIRSELRDYDQYQGDNHLIWISKCPTEYLKFFKMKYQKHLVPNLWINSIKSNHLKIVNFLLESETPNLNSGLSAAIVEGHYKMAQLLIEKGANNFNGGLLGAASFGNFPLVQLMIQHGADIHHHGDMALEYAVNSGNLEIVTYLVELGANVQARNNIAVQVSAFQGDYEITKYLIDNGADSQIIDFRLPWTQVTGGLELTKLINPIVNEADRDWILLLENSEVREYLLSRI